MSQNTGLFLYPLQDFRTHYSLWPDISSLVQEAGIICLAGGQWCGLREQETALYSSVHSLILQLQDLQVRRDGILCGSRINDLLFAFLSRPPIFSLRAFEYPILPPISLDSEPPAHSPIYWTDRQLPMACSHPVMSTQLPSLPQPSLPPSSYYARPGLSASVISMTVSNRTVGQSYRSLHLSLLQIWNPCGAAGHSGLERLSYGVSQIEPHPCPSRMWDHGKLACLGQHLSFVNLS